MMLSIKLLAVAVSVAFSAGCAQLPQSPAADAKPAAAERRAGDGRMG